jgi:hypothetical protein
MNKKIVISSTNTRAISFFNELAKRKAELQAKLEKKFSFTPSNSSIKKQGK